MLKGNKREKNCLYCSIYFLTGIIIWLFIKNVIQIEPAIGGPLKNIPAIELSRKHDFKEVKLWNTDYGIRKIRFERK